MEKILVQQLKGDERQKNWYTQMWLTIARKKNIKICPTSLWRDPHGAKYTCNKSMIHSFGLHGIASLWRPCTYRLLPKGKESKTKKERKKPKWQTDWSSMSFGFHCPCVPMTKIYQSISSELISCNIEPFQSLYSESTAFQKDVQWLPQLEIVRLLDKVLHLQYAVADHYSQYD